MMWALVNVNAMNSPTAGHGNEPDNDRTNTPTATQIGRLFHLSFVSYAGMIRFRFDGSNSQSLSSDGAPRRNGKLYPQHEGRATDGSARRA